MWIRLFRLANSAHTARRISDIAAGASWLTLQPRCGCWLRIRAPARWRRRRCQIDNIVAPVHFHLPLWPCSSPSPQRSSSGRCFTTLLVAQAALSDALSAHFEALTPAPGNGGRQRLHRRRASAAFHYHRHRTFWQEQPRHSRSRPYATRCFTGIMASAADDFHAGDRAAAVLLTSVVALSVLISQRASVRV